MRESIVKKIASLPPLPRTLHEFEVAYKDENVTIEQIAKILEQDPMIVANVLKRVNSPFYGLSKKIESLQHAVSILGLSEVRAIVLENSIKKLLNIDVEPYGVNAEQFARISQLQSFLVQKWYKSVDPQKAGFLSLAALLQESGKILIADEVIRDDLTLQFQSELDMSNDVAQVERSFVGVSAAEVTAKIFEHWGMQETLCRAIGYSDEYAAAPEDIKELSLALHIVKRAVPINKPLAPASRNIAKNIATKEGLDASKLEEAMEAIANL